MRTVLGWILKPVESYEKYLSEDPPFFDIFKLSLLEINYLNIHVRKSFKTVLNLILYESVDK